MNQTAVTRRQDTPVARLKTALASVSVKEQFDNALQGNSGLFIASLIDVYGSDGYLQKCEPGAVIQEALKAATLKLPINKSLGYAYIVPYKNQPQFQIGYKGYLQLAQRTGKYRCINADTVFEGENVTIDRITGDVSISGSPTSGKVVGYFAYIETVTGFKKTIYWDRGRVDSHAKRFSQSYRSSYSPWKTDFDAMAIKTVLKYLLSKYGIMTVEFASAIGGDGDNHAHEAAQSEVDENANGDIIDVEPIQPGHAYEPPPYEPSEEEKAEIHDREMSESGMPDRPDF